MPVNLVRRCLLLVLVLGTALWPSAAQAATKGYTLNIASAGVVGTQVTYNATFKVLTNQQQLGSANLTPPAGFRNVTASTPSQANVPVVAGVIELRNLALQPAATLVVTVKANISCTSVTSTTWTVQAKQANDFNGVPGNDLTLDTLNSSLSTPVTEACSQAQTLRFISQPANASTIAAIPGSAGSPVSVQVLDGAGHPVTTPVQVSMSVTPGTGPGSLGGTTTATTGANGVAQFANLRIATPGVYRLRASSPGLTSVDSATFTVDTVNIPCPTTGCSATAQSGQSAVSLTVLAGGQATDVLRLSYGLDGGTPIDCPTYDELTSDEVRFDITGDRAKVATYRIDKAAVATVPNNGATFLQLCFGSPEPFATRPGTPLVDEGPFDWNRNGVIDPGESHLNVGLLPDCPVTPAGPCISKRQKSGAGDGIIEAQLPAGFSGDPRMIG